MKVMHVIESMGHGGAEWLVVEHVRHAGPGVESMVCAINTAGAAMDAAAALGARTFDIAKGGRRAQALGRLAALLRRERIDVVNAHNPVAALYATPAARWAGVPVVIRTEHSVHYPGRVSRLYPLWSAMLTVVTSRVVCVCRAALDSHVRLLPWAARRFVTVANGVSSAPHTRARETLRTELGVAPHQPVALTVGSLTPQKAQDRLLEAFATVARQLPDAVLWIAGAGRLRADLDRRVEALGLGRRVRMLGARTDVADLLEACDLFVLSSVREGLPVTVLEAMRAARPVVATDAGGTAEAVEDGVTGRIVPMRDTPALASALIELLSDAARREAFGRAGQARWREHFTAERMVRETEDLYRVELARAGRDVAPDPAGLPRAAS